MAPLTPAPGPGFLPFGEALVFVRSLGLTGQAEWRAWCKGGVRPRNVPASPETVYKDHGWQGLGHWLGTGNTQNGDQQFMPFAEALAVARSLGLKSQKEWLGWSKGGMRPRNVPSNPNKIYKDYGWQGWGHWLGTGNQRSKEFLPFGEALGVARSLGLASRFEWQQWSKEGLRPRNVPSAPNDTYKDAGWRGWGHWLGTGNTKRGTKQFLPFAEALVVARSVGLASETAWRVWRKSGMRPPNVPSHPDRTYNDAGWQGWGHWLGTGNLTGGQRGRCHGALSRGATPGPGTATGATANARASRKRSAGTLGAPPSKRTACQHARD